MSRWARLPPDSDLDTDTDAEPDSASRPRAEGLAHFLVVQAWDAAARLAAFRCLFAAGGREADAPAAFQRRVLPGTKLAERLGDLRSANVFLGLVSLGLTVGMDALCRPWPPASMRTSPLKGGGQGRWVGCDTGAEWPPHTWTKLPTEELVRVRPGGFSGTPIPFKLSL